LKVIAIRSDDVAKALSDAKIDGCHVRLTSTLSREVYLQVNKILEALGGKWNRRLKVRVFDSDPSAALESAILTGGIVDKKATFQFFETPVDLAHEMVLRANLKKNSCILEPSAGSGRLVQAILAHYQNHGIEAPRIDVCELQYELRSGLNKFPGVNVVGTDFLEIPVPAPGCQKYDRIIANPPFANQADVRHMMHMLALLRPGGRLVSICSRGVTFRRGKVYDAFQQLISRLRHVEIEPLPDGAFAESGTRVQTSLVVLDNVAD